MRVLQSNCGLSVQVAGQAQSTASKIEENIGSGTMKLKKSRIELAREIIANLRRGMNRPSMEQKSADKLREAEPFLPMPTPRGRKSRQLQTSHT